MTHFQDVFDISLVATWSRLGKAHIAQSASDLDEMLARVISVGIPVFDSVGLQELGTIKAVEFLLADQVDGWDVDDVHDVGRSNFALRENLRASRLSPVISGKA